VLPLLVSEEFASPFQKDTKLQLDREIVGFESVALEPKKEYYTK
jgi:hypothetical protein